MRKACGVEVLLFEIARCLWICSSFYSNFEKQNRKGSPQSLIYPLKGKLTFFVIKQFFAFGREHQTLMRSRLRRFCSERCIAADADQKANYFYAAACTLLSPQNFDSPFGLPQDDTLTLETLWLFVTLSKRGIEPLRLCNTVYLRARRSFAF